MPRWKPRTDIQIIRKIGPIPPVGTRGEGKHPSQVLRKARDAYDAGDYASLDEAAEAFYEEFSGRKVSEEKTEADYRRHLDTTKRMRAKLRSMGRNPADEAT